MSTRAVAIRALGLAFAVCLFGCDCKPSSNPSAFNGKKPKRAASRPLRIHMDHEPPALIPMLQPDSWAKRITNHRIFQALVRHQPRSPYRIVGELAERFSRSKDGKTYTFELRKGVRWHDGKPFSAKDVAFTLSRVLDPNVRAVSTRATLAPFIARHEALSPHRYRIVCKRRSPFFLAALADMSILPAHLMSRGDINRHPMRRAPVGTGPYRFFRWQTGQQIELRRFDGYWGKKPAIERVVFRLIRSGETAVRLAQRGELDFLPRLHGITLRRVLEKRRLMRRFRVLYHVTPGTSYVLFNHQRPAFADVRVRRALAMLLDVETIVSKLLAGRAKRIGSLYWVDDPHHDRSLKPLAFDPQAAAKLLDQAGLVDKDKDGMREHAGKPLRLSLLLPAGSRVSRRWATLYQEQLKKVGIELSILPVEWAAFLSRIRAHDFDMAPLGMAISGLSTDLYLQFHSSQQKDGQNYGAFGDPEVDKLLEAIRSELDEKKREQLSRRVQKRLFELMPVIPLFTLTAPALVSKEIEGVYRSPLWYQLEEMRFGAADRR
jgi:peptide/nickel transport system substrate-binding protein